MKKKSIKILSSLSVFFVLLLSLDLRAQAISMSPVAVWVNELNKNIQRFTYDLTKTSQLNVSLPNGKITSDQVDWGGHFQLQQVQPELNQLKAAVSIQNLQVIAKNVQIQISIEKDLGFGSATLHLNATCAAITMHLKEPQPLYALIDKSLQVLQISETIPSSAFEMIMTGCTEIAGLDQAIQEKVLDYVRTQLMTQEIHQVVSREINLQLNKKINELAKTYLSQSISNPTVSVKIDDQLRLWAYLGENTEKLFSIEEISAISSNSKTTVLIKKVFLENTILNYLNSKVSAEPIFSSQTPQLKSLTCSRWSQFFAWPSLMALPKCFEMKIISRVKNLKLIDLKSMKFLINTETWAQAEKQHKDIAYFSSKINFSLEAMKPNLISFTGQQFPDFLNWSRASNRMPTSQIGSAFETFLSHHMTNLKLSQDPQTNLILSWLKFEKVSAVGMDSVSFQLKD